MSGPARQLVCKRGHDQTLPGMRKNGGGCFRCRQITGGAYYARVRPEKRKNLHSKEAARVKAILELIDELDRASTSWDRDRIKAAIAALSESHET